eukprot:g6020.t1
MTLSPDDNEVDAPIQVESLCMSCSKNGTTTILRTNIPHFRDVLIMAFECLHCGLRNNELQPISTCEDKGILLKLAVPLRRLDVLSRQIVKSDHAVITIPELEFEIPALGRKGCLTTVEGILNQAITDLLDQQIERRKLDPMLADKIDEFCKRLETCAKSEVEFTLQLDDPSGNSFIESPYPSIQDDTLLDRQLYIRSNEQNESLGILTQTEGPSVHHSHDSRGLTLGHSSIEEIGGDAFVSKYSAPEEVMVFPGSCLICHKSTETRMYPTKIPFFKEVIIMSNACESCGYKNSEIRPGGGVSPLGKSVRLRVTGVADLNRDVIKSESAGIEIPELMLSISSGTALISTVEGLIRRIITDLQSTLSFHLGDSAPEGDKEKYETFFASLERLLECEQSWNLVLRDPLANSIIMPLGDSIEDDQGLMIEEYERSKEEDEQFGIDTLKQMDELNQ